MTPAGSQHLTDDALIDLTVGLAEGDARGVALDHLRHCVPCERRFLEAYRGAEIARARAGPSPAGAAPVGRREGAATPVRRRLIGGAAAAAILLTVVALSLVRGRRPVDAYEYWLPLDSEGVLLRAGSPPPETASFRAAVEAYARRDTRAVVDLLGAQDIPAAYEPLKLVLASALIHEGRDGAARDLLGGMDVGTLPQPARDRAVWMLCGVLVRDGREKEAAAFLHLLAGTPGGEFGARARAALGAIEGTEPPVSPGAPDGR